MNRNFGLVTAVVVLIAGSVASPASAVTKTDKKQNKQIKALRNADAVLTPVIDGLESGLAGVQGGLAGVQGDLAGVKSDLGGVKADIQALATKVASGLAETAALSDGLAQTTTALTQLSTRFQSLVNSPEYGFVQLYFDPEDDGFEANDAVPGQLLVTADVPDDTNQATVSGTLMLTVPNGTTARRVALKAAIRSGEDDGTGAVNPVGVAGLMAMTASNIGGGGSSVGGGNPAAPTLPLTSAPNGALGGQPVYPIADKAARAGANPSVFPDAQAIELTDPSRLQPLTGAPSRFTVTNTSGVSSAVVFEITVRFHDPTPADPDSIGE